MWEDLLLGKAKHFSCQPFVSMQVLSESVVRESLRQLLQPTAWKVA
jgi:hypothetical protein